MLAGPRPRRAHLLIVVDQFEELLTQATPAARAGFAHVLDSALAGPVQVVGTLRPEFLNQLLADQDLAALRARVHTVRPLDREALRAVIQGPAQYAGIDVGEELVARLVTDTDSGDALPLLAYTLAQLAEGVGRGGRLLASRYEQLGGVQGALAAQADAALADAVATTGRAREQVVKGLLRLVTVDEQGRPTRWRVRRDELPEPVPAELDAFVARRLVTTDLDDGQVVVEVTHEAFVSAWPPLADAIAAEYTALQTRRLVEQAAVDWDKRGRPRDWLWQGGQLVAAITDLGERKVAGRLSTGLVELSPTARDFLTASRNRRRIWVRRRTDFTERAEKRTASTSTQKRPIWSRAWAEHAIVEADVLQRKLASMKIGQQSDDVRRTASVEAIQDYLSRVQIACERPAHWWHRIQDRWRGTSVESAYRYLHAAKLELIELLPDEEVEALVPKVHADMSVLIDHADPRRREFERAVIERKTMRRPALKQAAETIYEAEDFANTRVRAFRNIVIVAASLMCLMVIIIGLVGVFWPGALPMCFSGGAGEICPSGRSQPSALDVVVVSALGAGAGGLAAAILLRSIRGAPDPYGLPLALVVLKPPAGALTAASGILLLSGQFIPGLTALDTQAQILSYALVFGYAQQLLTQPIDRRAQSILGSVGADETSRLVASVRRRSVSRDDIRSAIDESVQRSLAPPLPPDIEGVVSARWMRDDVGRLRIRIAVRTGTGTGDQIRSGGTPFRLTGGGPRSQTLLEAAADLPGHVVNLGEPEISIRTDNGSFEWTGRVEPTLSEPLDAWVTLYTYGRFLQALPVDAERAE